MRLSFEAKLAILLIISAIFFYIVNYELFHDLNFIERYLLAQLGFLPISVLLVTLILNKLMVRREKMERMEKLNIVIGSFFAEVGKDLLRMLSKYDTNIKQLVNLLKNMEHFNEKDFEIVKRNIEKRDLKIDLEHLDLYELRRYLLDNKDFAINLLDNPAIIEHERFTDLLWNLLHVTEELRRIMNFESLNTEDYEDIKGDIERLYKLLVYEWIAYVGYLHRSHPHIFTYEVKTSPFAPKQHNEKRKKLQKN